MVPKHIHSPQFGLDRSVFSHSLWGQDPSRPANLPESAFQTVSREKWVNKTQYGSLRLMSIHDIWCTELQLGNQESASKGPPSWVSSFYLQLARKAHGMKDGSLPFPPTCCLSRLGSVLLFASVRLPTEASPYAPRCALAKNRLHW